MTGDITQDLQFVRPSDGQRQRAEHMGLLLRSEAENKDLFTGSFQNQLVPKLHSAAGRVMIHWGG